MADEITISVRAEDNFSGVLGNFGNIMTGLKSTIDLVSGAIQGAADFVGQFVDSASESEQAVARLEGVLRATGGAAGLTSEELQNTADAFQEVTRFSDETILNGASILLTFRNLSGEMFERTIPSMLDMAEIFGSVDSAAMQLGKALNDPLTGMGALSRAGVTFSEDQKAAIEAFVKTNDLASAQNIILSEVEAQVQGLATTMGATFAGQVEIAKNMMDSFKESIGTTALIIGKDLLGAFFDLTEGSALTDVQTFFDLLNLRLEKGLPFIQSFGMAILDIGMNSDNIAAGALDHLGYAILNVQRAIDESGWFSPEFFDAVRGAVTNFIRDFEAMTGLELSVSGLGEALVNAVKSIDWTSASQALADGISMIDWGKVGNVIAEGLGYIAIAIGTILSEIDWGALLNSTLNAIADLIGGLFGFVDWEDMWNSAVVGFRYVGQGIVDGIKLGIQWAWGNLLSILKFGIDDLIIKFKSWLGISSPSTVFMTIAKDIIQGLINGFILYWGNLITIAQNSLDDFLNIFGIDISFGGSSASGLGTAGGGVAGGSTGSGTSGEVHNYYYGPVYFMGGSEPGSYECTPNPILTAGSGTLVTSPR